MKKIILLILIIFTSLLSVGCNTKKISESDKIFYSAKINPIADQQKEISESQNIADKNDIKLDALILDEILLNVPFADQAPHKNWNEPYQEACEEASIIMANRFVNNDQTMDLKKDFIDQEILKMVTWQEKNMGGHYDLGVEETLNLFQKFYNYQGGKIVSIDSIDDIKRILSNKNIIIAPTYGRALNNPNFTAPGPVYHMLVIKGFDKINFITNDPGVWQGKNFTYSYQNLFDAICDLPKEAMGRSGYIKNHPNLMINGNKKVIVIQ